MALFGIAGIIGLVFNMVRGGLLGDAFRGKLINIIAFMLFAGFLAWGGLIDWFCVLLAGLAMWAGQQPSTGEFVGTILNRKLEDPNEHNWWDIVLEPLKEKPLLYAHVGALLRGLWWGSLVAVAMQTPWPVLAGCTLGVAYEAAYWLDKPFPKLREWKVGEAIFGFFLWAATTVH